MELWVEMQIYRFQKQKKVNGQAITIDGKVICRKDKLVPKLGLDGVGRRHRDAALVKNS